MKRILICGIIGLLAAISLSAQTVQIFQVPQINNEMDFAPSIAANRFGDVLVIYANYREGAMYYFRKRGTTTWIGPAIIPNQPYGSGWGDVFVATDVEASRDGNFHVMWAINAGEDIAGGIHYQKFNPVSEQWSEYTLVLPTWERTEKASMSYNSVTDEIGLEFCWVHNNNKDIYMLFKKASGNDWSDIVEIQVGGIADTEPAVAYDDTGRPIVVFKTDRLREGGDPEVEADWELVIRGQLHNTRENNWDRIWGDEITWDYHGWHFLPSVATLKGNYGMMTFVFYHAFGYHYVPLSIKEDRIDWDMDAIANQSLGPFPTVPHYMYQSNLHGYVDEFLFVYKRPNHSICMLRGSPTGVWDMGNIVDLSNGEATVTWIPFDSNVQPNVGVMAAWHTTERTVHFSIYDYKKIVVQPPVNAKVEHKQERSFFNQYYFNILTWENDPANTEQGITVTNFNLFRKAKGETKYVKMTEVSGSTFTYIDRVGVGPVNLYDYAISAVDSKGNESINTEIQ